MTRLSGRIPAPLSSAMCQHKVSKRACSSCAPKTASFLISNPSGCCFEPKGLSGSRCRHAVTVDHCRAVVPQPIVSRIQASIDALACEEVGMFAHFGDVPVLQYHDLVGIADGRKAVSNHNGGAPLQNTLQRMLDEHFRVS